MNEFVAGAAQNHQLIGNRIVDILWIPKMMRVVENRFFFAYLTLPFFSNKRL